MVQPVHGVNPESGRGSHDPRYAQAQTLRGCYMQKSPKVFRKLSQILSTDSFGVAGAMAFSNGIALNVRQSYELPNSRIEHVEQTYFLEQPVRINAMVDSWVTGDAFEKEYGYRYTKENIYCVGFPAHYLNIGKLELIEVRPFGSTRTRYEQGLYDIRVEFTFRVSAKKQVNITHTIVENLNGNVYVHGAGGYADGRSQWNPLPANEFVPHMVNAYILES